MASPPVRGEAVLVPVVRAVGQQVAVAQEPVEVAKSVPVRGGSAPLESDAARPANQRLAIASATTRVQKQYLVICSISVC